jgi:hypothetical protein
MVSFGHIAPKPQGPRLTSAPVLLSFGPFGGVRLRVTGGTAGHFLSSTIS